MADAVGFLRGRVAADVAFHHPAAFRLSAQSATSAGPARASGDIEALEARGGMVARIQRLGEFGGDRRLVRLLRSLEADDREILLLRDLEGMSGEQAREVLGLSLAAMKSRLHRALLRLAAAIRCGRQA
ncbi:MAG: sigma-70 region 4 domain-containing protein [Bryobacterales bacterium]